MTDFPPSSFWDYSVALYGKDEVAKACLTLQERHQLDVNLLFYCLWRASIGQAPLDGETMAALCRAVAEWHEQVVRHLRALRKRLREPMGAAPKALVTALRSGVATCELDAEHIEQLLLAGAIEREPERRDDDEHRAGNAVGNVARYFARLEIHPDDADRAEVAKLLGAAFPSLGPERIRPLVAGLTHSTACD